MSGELRQCQNFFKENVGGMGLIFSFWPGVSLLGHLSGFIAGCFLMTNSPQ